MTVQKYFTQEQIEEAKRKLADMPDLSSQKIPVDDMLAALKSEIITLANQKGYNAKEIKSVLDSMNMSVSERAVSGIIKSAKIGNSRTKKTEKKGTPSS